MKLKLENRRQKVVPLKHFILRLARYSVFAFLLIVLSIMIGCAGYHYWGNLGWLDSFHMSSMILTGMGPVSEMHSDKAKIFSSIYALYSGIAFLSITAVFFAPIIHRLLHILQVESSDDQE